MTGMPRGRLAPSTRWPAELVVVRHGQSVGNVADARAREQGATRLELELRDADVPLSDTGQQQADAVGRLLRRTEEGRLPEVLVSSPYRRAAETAERAVGAWGADVEVVLDERLRERDLGLFDGLTSAGVEAEHAHEFERRGRVGKFYYRPPSGESWCDVTLRVRSLLGDLRDACEGRRVWLFAHQAVIMSLRYVVEDLSEQELLDIDSSMDLPNCSITSYVSGAEGLDLVRFADTEALDDSTAPETAEPSKEDQRDDGP
jgi:broad specificity phosphatase PhoE